MHSFYEKRERNECIERTKIHNTSKYSQFDNNILYFRQRSTIKNVLLIFTNEVNMLNYTITLMVFFKESLCV